jgi:hypothetical protein
MYWLRETMLSLLYRRLGTQMMIEDQFFRGTKRSSFSNWKESWTR